MHILQQIGFKSRPRADPSFIEVNPFFHPFLMKYAEVFEEQLGTLCSMSKNGQFTPNRTQDIADTLLSLIRRHHHIYEAVAFQPYRQISGINIFKLKAVDRNDADEHCLFAGVELLTEIENKENLLARYCTFVSVFWNIFKPTVRRRFIIFDKTKTLTEDDMEHLRNDCQRTNRVKIFLC